MSKRENSATLYLYVKEYIVKLLLSGNYPPNAKLPTEFELMKALNVGRATVREALSRLEKEGFIYKKQGIGTFVSDSEKFSIHPFASFSYTAHSLGFNDKIELLKLDDFNVIEDNHNLLNQWSIGTSGRYARRLRIIEGAPVAIDEIYITDSAKFAFGDDFSFTESISDKIEIGLHSEIDHIGTDVIKRKITKKEADILKVPEDEDVVEIRRWVFATGLQNEPITFSNIIITSRLFKLQKDFR